MRVIKVSIYSLLLFSFVIILNKPLTIDGKTLPSIMPFMNPFSGFWQNAAFTDKNTDLIFKIDGLESPIDIIYDERLVPHVFAQSYKDALVAQGMLHAKHRLFQMEISNRDVAGTLAEILGPNLIEHDREKRYTGIIKDSESTLKMWENFPDGIAFVDAYLQGINQYIDALKPKNYPIEFKLLGIKPKKWERLDCALFLKNMAIMLASSNDDIENSNFRTLFGLELFNQLFPDWYPKQSPIIPLDYMNDQEIKSTEEKEVFDALNGSSIHKPNILDYPKDLGSNNWAIAPTKSKNKNAILCNDPHLRLSLPPIWYEMHIHTPETNVYGVSLPSLPGIIIGFNENIAWGVTNVGHDVTDWYKIKWLDKDQNMYEVDGRAYYVKKRVEHIKVKGAAELVDTIKYTIHGPVIPINASRHEIQGLARKWIGSVTQRLPEMLVFPQLNKAKNYTDFKNALNSYICPAQNFVYADIDGNIAIHVNGLLPVRLNDAAKFIKDGSVSDPEWKAFIPRSKLPQIKNPSRGFVSSANQHSTYPNYPYKYFSSGFEAYRGRRINQVLSSKRNMDIKDMKELQYDDYSLKAYDVLPHFLHFIDSFKISNHWTERLKKWDYTYKHDDVAPTYFEIWFKTFKRLLFDEIDNQKSKSDLDYPPDFKMISFILHAPNNPIFDIKSTENIQETFYDIFLLSIKETSEKINVLHTDNAKKWSNYNQRDINHLARIDAFSVKNIASNGNGDVPNANNNVWGPSWRMIVEMDKENGVNAYGVLPGGQEGNPASYFYKTGIETWANGKYFELYFPKSKKDFDKKVIQEIRLEKR